MSDDVKAKLYRMIDRLEANGGLPPSADDVLMIVVREEELAFITGNESQAMPRFAFLLSTLTLGLASLFEAIGEVEGEPARIARLRAAVKGFEPDVVVGPTAPGVN